MIFTANKNNIQKMQDYVDLYVPKLEEMLDGEIGKITVEKISMRKMIGAPESKSSLVKAIDSIDSFFFSILTRKNYAGIKGSSLMLNPYAYDFDNENTLRVTAVHEACHRWVELNNRNLAGRQLQYKDVSEEFKTFDEGFAEAVSLDVFRDHYGIDISDEISRAFVQHSLPANRRYNVGYILITDIMRKIGVDGVIDFMKSLKPDNDDASFRKLEKALTAKRVA